MRKIVLWCKQGTSDKVYHLEIVQVGKGYNVNCAYGRRGCVLRQQGKNPNVVSLATANSIFDSVLKEKLGKGYKIVEIKDLDNPDFVSTATATVTPPVDKKDTGMRPQLLNPILVMDAIRYLEDPDWCLQEKMDGKHIIVKYIPKEDKVIAANKKGDVISIPQSIVDSVKKLANEKGLTLDGELIGEYLYVFDILECEGVDLRGALDFGKRYFALEHLIQNQFENLILVKAYFKTKEKKAYFEKLKRTGREGAVFKDIHSQFSIGRPHSGGAMLKCKFTATLSVIVDSKVTGKSSFASFVYRDDRSKMPLGNCTVPVGREIPLAGTIVEIRYLYVLRGGHLYQPVYLGIRDDVDPEECTESQIKYKNEPQNS
jgi:bifunctional non-homologous end joining protein LigD